MKKVSLLLLMLSACILLGAQTNPEARYDLVDEYYEGLACVKRNGKYGFIDEAGKLVIPLKYDFAFPFVDGLACVELNDKCGFIDKTDKVVIPLKYDFLSVFNKDYALAVLDGKYGFIDKEDRVVVPIKYTDELSINERFEKLESGNYYSFEKKKIPDTADNKKKIPDIIVSNYPEEFVTINYDNGKYTGYVINGSKTRYGVYTWDTGDKFIGQWKNDRQNGIGIQIWHNGTIYIGDWNNGQLQGDGAEYDSKGILVYYGKYNNGKNLDIYPSSGYSSYRYEKISYSGGEYYEGETKNGNRDGFGVYYWKDGSYWFGRWVNGERNGYGVFLKRDGTVTIGNWVGDKCDKNL